MSERLQRPPLSRRQVLTWGAASWGLMAGTLEAQTPPWPARPVKLVVAYPPGGLSDTVARWLAERLAVRWNVPVLVDNKAGASGGLGVQAVAKSVPDGYTLVFSALSPITLSPHVGKPLFDPLQDIAPVSGVMTSPVLLLATPATSVMDLKSLLVWAKAQPGALRWATSGSASLGHVMLEQLQVLTQAVFTHIPYKGGGQQITDALSGQFELLSVNSSPAVLQHIKDGRLRPLAVGSPVRLESLPHVPTLAERGWAPANVNSQFGVFAPGGTPQVLLERLHADLQAVLSQSALRERLLAAECLPLKSSLAEFTRSVAQEFDAMGRIVKSARIVGES